VLSLAGCSGLSQLQDPISKFDQGAHSVATAQMTFFGAVRTAECESQFYGTAYDFASGRASAIDLRGNCSPQRLTDQQITTRQNLMSAITLYADQIQALAASGDDKNLDTNAQGLASKLNALAKSGGFAESAIGADVEAAVIGLTGMVIDNGKFHDIRAAATSEQENLAKVATTLKNENANLSSGIDSSLGTIRAELTATLADTKKNDGQAVFFQTVQARSILQTANPFGLQPIAASAGALDPNTNPTSVVQQLNAALDSLVIANHAIATAGTGGIVAAVNDLVARAQQAQAIQAALSK
jgi:hypothetical protein